LAVANAGCKKSILGIGKLTAAGVQTGVGESSGMTASPTFYPRYLFPAEIITRAVWQYYVFNLSLRDVELILAERGVVVTHESVRHWCRKFGGEFARELRRRRPKPGDTSGCPASHEQRLD
jgi:putative transposase